MDEVLSLSQTSPQDWEETLSRNLWDAVKDHAIESIYLPAAQTGNARQFKTKVDILLKEWADRVLPLSAIRVRSRENIIGEFVLKFVIISKCTWSKADFVKNSLSFCFFDLVLYVLRQVEVT